MSIVHPSSILSSRPPVVYSRSQIWAERPLGLANRLPTAFAQGPSYHIIALTQPHRTPVEVQVLAAAREAFRKTAPLARFLFLARTEAEATALAGEGLSVVRANPVCLVDTDRFTIQPPEAEDGQRFQAVYVSAFHPAKRHNLASELDSALLIYWEPNALQALRMRQELPRGVFANHAEGDGVYRILSGKPYSAQLSRARVGLCLGDTGSAKAAVEYMLHGLPVVATPSLDGRSEFFSSAFFAEAPAESSAIADAVARQIQRNSDPRAIRWAALVRIYAERSRLFRGVNDWLDALGARHLSDAELERMVAPGIWLPSVIDLSRLQPGA